MTSKQDFPDQEWTRAVAQQVLEERAVVGLA